MENEIFFLMEAHRMDYDAIMAMPVTRRFRMIRKKIDVEAERKQKLKSR